MHLVVNDEGELLAFCLTPGNVNDLTPVPRLMHKLWGKLFADRGYIPQTLFEQLFERDIQLITKLSRTMKNRLMPMLDKLLLRKRAILESIVDRLKNISQVEHTRHRSFHNFLGNLVAGLPAYTWRPTKPSLGIRPQENDSFLPILVA